MQALEFGVFVPILVRTHFGSYITEELTAFGCLLFEYNLGPVLDLFRVEHYCVSFRTRLGSISIRSGITDSYDGQAPIRRTDTSHQQVDIDIRYLQTRLSKALTLCDHF